ncbi:protein LNK1-like isoform X3 [Nymphaea colorata]|uniref:protein LNK1-like isoform X3 n=1 Tax=Nymphaea colorata TaxID=210225 RepID=UPI00129E0B58|nr:protein LNK1-like isoform X3 [Nymphaea colorata]
MLGSEWSSYELEDIVWDEFGESDDHIVPRPGSGLENACAGHVDCTKKPCLELENPTEGGTDDTVSVNVNDFDAENGGLYPGTKKEPLTPSIETSSWPENVLNDPYSTEDADKVELLAEGKNKLSGNEERALIDEFSDGDPILRNRDSMNYSDLCAFSLTDISPTDTDLELFGSELEDKESSSFLGYGWPNIGNFDDVDKMFRNCDATFGQQSADNADDQAWASSSSLRTDGTDAKLVFRSSDLDMFPLKNEKEHDGADDLDKQTYPSYGEKLNRDSEVERATQREKQVDGQRTLFKSQSQFEGKRSEASLERARAATHASDHTGENLIASASPPLISQAYASTVKAPEMQRWRSDSFRYMDTDMSDMQLGYSYNSDQVLVQGLPFIKPEVQSHVSLPYNVPGGASRHRKALHRSRDPSPKHPGMTPEEKIEKLRRRQKMRAALSMMQQQTGFVCQTQLADQAPPVQVKPEGIHNEVRGQTKAEMQSLENSALEIDSATQESSCMSSMLTEDSSLEEACLCQLQDVITQLNNKTKLCIRDSLYRLARSAMQRHNVGDANSCCKGSRDKNESLGMDGHATQEKLQSERCEGLINMETVTNPIDRAVAHLLFHKPPDVSAKPLNGMLPLESHITANIQKSWMSHVFAYCSGQPNHSLPSIHNDLNKQGHHLSSRSVSPKEQAHPIS